MDDEIRSQEYEALMCRCRDLMRTSMLCWTGAMVAAMAMLSMAIGQHQPGLLLPVEFATAFGFYAAIYSRREASLIEGYVQAFHEHDGTGAQWHTRLAHLHSLPGYGDTSHWLPLVLANATCLMAVVFGWIFASNAQHGELMAAFVTMAGVAFSVHSIVESMRADQIPSDLWARMNEGLREVSREMRRTGTR